MADAPESPLARGVRWLTTVPVTVAFCVLLSLVFLAEVYVLTTVGFEAFATVFVAKRQPSPGWVLAPLAHSLVRELHLVTNVAQLLVFGGLAERRIGRARYVGLLVASGVATTGAQVGSYAVAGPSASEFGTLGASGIALAAVGLVVVDSLRHYRATGEWRGEAAWVWTLLGGLIVGRAVLDLFVASPRTAVVGHLTGVGIGVVYVLVGRGTTGRRPGADRE